MEDNDGNYRKIQDEKIKKLEAFEDAKEEMYDCLERLKDMYSQCFRGSNESVRSDGAIFTLREYESLHKILRVKENSDNEKRQSEAKAVAEGKKPNNDFYIVHPSVSVKEAKEPTDEDFFVLPPKNTEKNVIEDKNDGSSLTTGVQLCSDGNNDLPISVHTMIAPVMSTWSSEGMEVQEGVDSMQMFFSSTMESNLINTGVRMDSVVETFIQSEDDESHECSRE
mmetsp:Transcript_7186/g.7893  ORF Transcript_7186/g.7893 Transcript_7186/m.7893 type:complete len:224 (+) Transcript_7186:405-1076(+)